MKPISRREWLTNTTAAAGAVLGVSSWPSATAAAVPQLAGERPQSVTDLTVVNPRGRVPVSFIIDDSTCLVNLAHYAMPQFSAAWPERKDYQLEWQKWPREIPDSFVRSFGEWCADKDVKGKYSIVPQPACVGWVDRELPGWSQRQLQDSLELVRTLMLPNWDIHPEMATHTRVIDTKTGRPYPDIGPQWMENWQWTDGKSVDQLADYLSYSLTILKNAGLPCEGVTTPGGFAGKVVPELAQATLQSVKDVFRAEIPHYFKFLYTDDRSVVPQVQYASGLKTNDPQCVVSVVGCTGDWFGGWDGTTPGSPDQFITADLQQGRMVDVIERGEPAIMVCHWPGMYYNGTEHGFNVFKTVVERLHRRFNHLHWMKLSEIARYWAAKELTSIQGSKGNYSFTAPYACPDFTVSIPGSDVAKVQINDGTQLEPVSKRSGLKSGTYFKSNDGVLACFDMRKGTSQLSAR
mgnify:CR=1 FL=1|jgi:hypothetical protein